MRKAIFTLLTALMLVFSTSLVLAASSASVAWTSSTYSVFQGNSTNLVANITNNGDVIENITVSMDLSDLGLSNFSQSITNLGINASQTVTIPINTTDDTDAAEYDLSLVLRLVASANASDNATVTSAKSLDVFYTFDGYDEIVSGGDLRISDINEDDFEGEEFKPLDEFEVEVEVENINDDDSVDATVEVYLVQGNDEVDDSFFDAKGDIEEDDDYKFRISGVIPADIEEGAAYLYVVVYNDDEDENIDYEVFEITIEKDSQDLSPIELEYPKTVSCGDTFTFSGKIANIGGSDEEKVRVKLTALNQEFEEEYNDLDSGDISPVFSFDVVAPANMNGSVGKMTLRVDYDYDEDDEEYDDYDSYSYTFTIPACKLDKADFTTETSTALEETQSEVRFTISNPLSVAQTFSVSATASWATVDSVTPATVTLEGGKSQVVAIKLTPNEDLDLGTYNVNAKVSYGSETESLSLPVSVQKAAGSDSFFGKVGNQFKTNTAWIVTDLVLAVAIIVLLVLLFTGKSK